VEINGRLRRFGVVVAAAGMVAGVAGCGGPSKPNVTVELSQANLALKPGTANEGKVKFDINNTGTGAQELLILRVADPTKVVLTPEGDIDTSKISIADTVKEFAPGRFRAVSPNLIAGTYVVAVTTPGTAADGKPTHRYEPAKASKLTLKPLRP
jgi:hypothetical protein